MMPSVLSVALSATHRFSKEPVPSIELIEGLGVFGDAHFGSTVQHRSRVAVDPLQPNLRQVHLLHVEVFEDLRRKGFELHPGQIGENVLTRGIDLLGLPTGTRLHLGPTAVVTITGLRNPCGQLDSFRPGLLTALLDRDASGALIRLAGVMAVVSKSGPVCADMPITVMFPAPPHRPLERV